MGNVWGMYGECVNPVSKWLVIIINFILRIKPDKYSDITFLT